MLIFDLSRLASNDRYDTIMPHNRRATQYHRIIHNNYFVTNQPSTQFELTCTRIGWRIYENYHRQAVRYWYTSEQHAFTAV